MAQFYWQPEWPEKIAQQEDLLRYKTFTRDMALELGMKIRQLAQEVYHNNAAIRIIEDGTIIFAFKMEGTSSENDWWMDRKLAVARLTGTSSLRAYVEAEAGLRKPEWDDRPYNFATCGGCFPVMRKDGKAPCCHVLVSGMEHQDDHQIIVDAMSWQLGMEVPSITK